MFDRIRSTIEAVVFRSRMRRDLDEEMEFHVDRLAEDLMLQGMEPGQARREARIRFGATEPVHERARGERGVALADELGRNLRFALRSFRRSPLLSGTFVLTLGLCIGFGTAVFSTVDSVLWKPLPYPDADRLALSGLYDPDRGGIEGRVAVDGAAWFRIRDEAEGFSAAVYTGWAKGVNLSAGGAARFASQQRVGAGFFETLGVPPMLGRGFSPDEDVPEGPALVILSHDLWTTLFDGDQEALGRTIRLKGELHTVIGIMPEGFRTDADADLWTPLRPSMRGEGGGTNYTAVVRLPEGMTWEEARARLAAIAPPEGADGPVNGVFGLVPLDQALSAGLRLPLLVLLVAVGLLILVGCANLAGVQVSRALARDAEMSTRQALGSGGGALVRQLLTENLVLGVLGGAVGLGVAWISLGALGQLLRANLGLEPPTSLDGRALAVSAGLTVAATMLFGMAPLLHARRADALRLLVSGTRSIAGGRVRSLRRLLLVGQVAMVTVMLFAAMLLVRSYGHLASLEPGFEPSGVMTAQLSLDDARFSDAESIHQLFDETLDELRRIPAVQNAAVALSLPYERPLNMPFRLPGDDPDGTPRLTNLVYVTPDFFETLGIPLLEGRLIETSDGAGAPPIAVVNRALARMHLEDRAALGVQLDMGMGGGVEVVGVVGDVQQGGGGWGSNQPVWAAPTIYVPASQVDGPVMSQVHVWFSPSWVIRSSGPASGLAGQVARVFESLDSELPVARTASLREVVEGAFARTRFQAGFLLVVALFALLLAGVGLYGIVAHEVEQGRREMGVRMALGVSTGRAVVGAGLSGVRLAGWGLLAGAVGAVGVGRVMAGLIWGVGASDPVTIMALIAVIGGLAALASFVPAMRIGRLDPATILRD